MRKRKLYLSELLKRCLDEKLAVHFTDHFYDSTLECLQLISESETYWNAEIESWLVTTYEYSKHRKQKVLCIKLK